MVDGFQKPAVLMAGAAPKTAHQMCNILVVGVFDLKLVDELLFGQSAAKEAKKSPL